MTIFDDTTSSLFLSHEYGLQLSNTGLIRRRKSGSQSVVVRIETVSLKARSSGSKSMSKSVPLYMFIFSLDTDVLPVNPPHPLNPSKSQSSSSPTPPSPPFR